MTTTKKLTVLLLVGGDSTERDVSLNTGKSVYQALMELGYRVLIADPLKPEGKPTEDPAPFFDDAGVKVEPASVAADRHVMRRRFIDVLGGFDDLGCDVVFNALHGGAGEDGTIQAVLDYLGIRYTGSGACACAVAMNKDLSKRIVAGVGVPVARQIFVDSMPHESVVVDQRVMETLSLPVVVKPNNEGSSVGVTVVPAREELAAAIQTAKSFGGAYLIEEYIPGTEVTAAMLDDTELPLLEIRPKQGFYDYRNKYQSGSCEYHVPAPIDPKTAEAIAGSARAAYRALGCSGYARIDFRLREDGRYIFLESNNLPGMTANSLVPKAALAAGIEFAELVERILRLSIWNNPVH